MRTGRDAPSFAIPILTARRVCVSRVSVSRVSVSRVSVSRVSRSIGSLCLTSGELTHATGKIRDSGISLLIGRTNGINHYFIATGRNLRGEKLSHVLSGAEATGSTQRKTRRCSSTVYRGGHVHALVIALSEEQWNDNSIALSALSQLLCC